MKSYSWLLVLGAFFTIIPMCAAQPADVQTIIADPGDTVTFNGTGAPGSTVGIGVSTSVAVDNRQGRYSIGLDGLEIPAGKNRFSLAASPVESMTVSGGTSLIKGLSMAQGVKVIDGRGAFSVSDVPPGQYDIMVYGDTGAAMVNLNVTAQCLVDCGADGGYSASVNTRGMPPGVYEVRQNGSLAAIVYLGVPGPAGSAPAASHTAVIPGDKKISLSGEPGLLTITLMAGAFVFTGAYLFKRRKKDH